MDTDRQKKALRQKMKRARAELSDEQREAAARRILEALKALPGFRRAETVYLYAALPDELPTKGITEYCLSHGKIVALPRVEGDVIRFRRINAFSELHPGVMGILEPSERAPELRAPGLMIVPGLAFDDDNNRLGYGAGFYDRYLADHPGMFTVGVGFECQRADAVPTDYYDKPLSEVLFG
ncbi:MAG: 5-formyltetrahydrofolate cyclo-ligase [Clostridia bacterium]|nr:5-formyltetrahydrofolate cyclo-ligase [Clostridia bacterium]